MDRKEDFTYSSQFGDMPSMVDVLHQEGLHYVMIVVCLLGTPFCH